MTTLEEFNNEYLVKNGMFVSEDVLNKPSEQLKKEINELNETILNMNIGTINEFNNIIEGI